MPRDAFRLAFRANMSAESDTGELMLYGEITQNLPKWYKDNYPDDKSAIDFDKAVKDLKKAGAKKLLLRINSPGGVVNEAIAMRAIITGAGFENIDVHIEGMCASAATILASIPDAHVSIAPGSEYMIHNPWTYAAGSAADLEKAAEHLHQLEDTTRGFYVQKTGQAEEQLQRWMDEEKWFTAEEAVQYGFADEITAEGNDAMPAVACVSAQAMNVMRELYKQVPDGIAISGEAPEKNSVSNDAPVAGSSTENKETQEEEHENMDIKDLNLETLLAENPALIEQIQQNAVSAERQRQDDIDALTLPGYEQMAADAKANGTSAMDFQRQLVAAMKQKGSTFMQQRQTETAPAKNVAGGAPQDEKHNEAQELESAAKDIAEFAKAYNGGSNVSMF